MLKQSLTSTNIRMSSMRRVRRRMRRREGRRVRRKVRGKSEEGDWEVITKLSQI